MRKLSGYRYLSSVSSAWTPIVSPLDPQSRKRELSPIGCSQKHMHERTRTHARTHTQGAGRERGRGEERAQISYVYFSNLQNLNPKNQIESLHSTLMSIWAHSLRIEVQASRFRISTESQREKKLHKDKQKAKLVDLELDTTIEDVCWCKHAKARLYRSMWGQQKKKAREGIYNANSRLDREEPNRGLTNWKRHYIWD